MVEEGMKYSFILPGGQLQVAAEEVNPEQTFEFTVPGDAGIESLSSESPFNIYNLNGNKILNKVNNNDIRKLSPGIYIIDGKKVIVK